MDSDILNTRLEKGVGVSLKGKNDPPGSLGDYLSAKTSGIPLRELLNKLLERYGIANLPPTELEKVVRPVSDSEEPRNLVVDPDNPSRLKRDQYTFELINS